MKKRDSEYDAAVQKHLRGEISSNDVWKADPYDSALQRMAQRATQRDIQSKAKDPKGHNKARLD